MLPLKQIVEVSLRDLGQRIKRWSSRARGRYDSASLSRLELISFCSSFSQPPAPYLSPHQSALIVFLRLPAAPPGSWLGNPPDALDYSGHAATPVVSGTFGDLRRAPALLFSAGSGLARKSPPICGGGKGGEGGNQVWQAEIRGHIFGQDPHPKPAYGKWSPSNWLTKTLLNVELSGTRLMLFSNVVFDTIEKI